MLTILSHTLDFFLAVPFGFLLLLTSLGLLPVVLFKVLVLFGRVVAFEVSVNFLRVKFLREADVNNLVVVKHASVIFASEVLVVLDNVPLILVQLN